jgi:predicted 3-demethylubiquinone-9 3-methyltransferase (glyoxalase superfamily)
MTLCHDRKILNPKTNRYVDINGKIGKIIYNRIQGFTEDEHLKQKKLTKSSPTKKECSMTNEEFEINGYKISKMDNEYLKDFITNGKLNQTEVVTLVKHS